MKLLDNLLRNDQEVESSNFRWIRSDKKLDLEEINLETMEKASYGISSPTDYNALNTCICSLPGNKSFCYRGYFNYSNHNGIAFIIDEDHKIQILPSEMSTVGYCATYYNNFVYMFGDSSLCRYNLIKRRWEKLVNKCTSGNCCSCTSLNGMIFVALYDYAYAFIFDLWTFSYSLCNLELEQDCIKIICKYDNVAYLIDFSGLIWESDENDLYIWNIIGPCNPLYFYTYSIKVFYKNSWYFNMDSVIMKFNLDKKTVSKTSGSISYEYGSSWNKEYPIG
ncbi:unnamed protein product [Blepharisma stoltei]|uniref:Uncharacterized protein n=1 Tax=Blepharisma stoltei TaxID=1481888 RepID=A0AAU9J4P1_9CILI|nr:unnamed protein product [Blepharisma stoltei]